MSERHKNAPPSFATRFLRGTPLERNQYFTHDKDNRKIPYHKSDLHFHYEKQGRQ